ncbi:MAG TPA: type IV toxin-antitoxin system AbiEi family antitoxin [Opitutaceae bacterium]|nr:type IV toxin-antitoxin system AbiEi family antitoxin [Opitutaceae bacterium]
MRIPEKEDMNRAADVLGEILAVLPGVELVRDKPLHMPAARPLEIDFTLTVKSGATEDLLAVDFKSAGHPKQLREAINQLLRLSHQLNQRIYPVVAAPYITEDGANLCREENVGYFDLAGNFRLAFGNYYLERSGRRNPSKRVETGKEPDLYGKKAERILRALLEDSGRPWKVIPLAKETKTSLGTVSTVRTLLLNREWAKMSENGLVLTHPEKLLKDWAGVWARRRTSMRNFASLLSTENLEQAITQYALDRNLPFALTGAAGAWRIAPMTRFHRIQAYFLGDVAEMAATLNLKEVDQGATLQFLEPRDSDIFRHTSVVERVPVVSPVQLYLDLQRESARGKEAADHLWTTRLFPQNAAP